MSENFPPNFIFTDKQRLFKKKISEAKVAHSNAPDAPDRPASAS
jgi:hypothetical protein